MTGRMPIPRVSEGRNGEIGKYEKGNQRPRGYGTTRRRLELDWSVGTERSETSLERKKERPESSMVINKKSSATAASTLAESV